VRVAISNLAWDVAEDEAVATQLARHRVDAVDLAPGKYFPDPPNARVEDISRVRQWWKARGIEITGLQALLFGTSGLNLFGPPESRAAMLDRLRAICRIGEHLGARWLVFGSPKNRDRSGLADAEVEPHAVAFFRDLGAIAGSHGVCICLEPNPARYGCNFMTTTAETAGIVRTVGHPAIRLQLDAGALTLNGEDAERIVASHADIIGHVHASEPDLVPLGLGTTDHGRVAGALRRHAPDRVVSIEMLPAKDEPHGAAIERALALATRAYRDGEAAAEGCA
jgi:sugar phosphate isomerase/epimerase